MKKILSVLFIFGVLSAAADDSYLYWMLGDTGYTGGSSTGTEGVDYSQVKVRSVGGDYLTIYAPDPTADTGLTTEGYDSLSYAQASSGALYAYLASSGAPYSSFIIELRNDSGALVAQSEALDYSEAVAKYYITTANSMHLPTAWAPTSFAIPEPNSAMLLLLGCAALGLKRRRQLKA